MAIRLRRRKIGLSQRQLAGACGVTFQQIEKYENGLIRVSSSRLIQIARALRCRVGDLVVEVGSARDDPADIALRRRLDLDGVAELPGPCGQLRPAEQSALVDLLKKAQPERGS